MGRLLQDIRYGLRTLISAPAFSAIAVLTLALGIGANISIFTVVNAVLLRPLPFTHPEQLVRVIDNLNGPNVRDIGMSEPELEDLRDRAGIFEQITAIFPASAALTGGDRPERVELLATSANYFRLLGAHAQLGRVYGPEDGVPGFSDPVVISDGLWRRLFGADPNILGRKVRVDTDLYTVIGVMPPDFRHPGQTVQGDVELWAACGFTAAPFPAPPQRGQNFIPGAIGRLRAGVSIEQAQSQLDAFVAHLTEMYPKNYTEKARWGLHLESVQENLTGNVRPTLTILLAAVGFVLLIACVNVASLLLARSSGRVREMAIRRALGASRGRLIRQLLTESLLISFAGGAAALLVLGWLKSWLLVMLPGDLPRLGEVQFDYHIAGFAFLLSFLTGVLFGVVPAWRISAVNPNSDLKEGARTGGASFRQNRFRSALVSTEIALSLVLLIGAGLLMRSFLSMLQVHPGFDPDRLGLAQIWIPVPNNPALNPYLQASQRGAFVSEVLRRVRALPGVEVAAMGSGSTIPFSGSRNSFPLIWADDPTAGGGRMLAEFGAVSPDYFRALKAPLIRGRFFEESDNDPRARVVLVNETFVKRYSPQRDAVGRSIDLGRGNNPIRVVGVVGDLHDDGLDLPVSPRVYSCLLQNSGFAMTVYFRTTSAPGQLNEAVMKAIHAVDPELPVYGLHSMRDLMAAGAARRAFVLRLMGIFAAVALLLAALGIYGVMAYTVSQRTQEIGIRIALGAQRGDIVRLALKPGMILTAIGVAGGIVASLFLTRMMATLLFAVTPTDLVTYGCVTLVLAAVALLACYIPARRATKVDPMVALRYE
jgi:putative ABC transport system permease protein